MECISEILVKGWSLFGQVKYVVMKIFFSKGGVTLWYAPVKFQLGGQVGQVKSVEI